MTCPVEINSKTTIFVTGDSTTGLNPPSSKTGEKVGWSDLFDEYINEANVNFQNKAIPGFSLRDYIHRGAMYDILQKTKGGDILLACHGHLEGTPLVRKGDRARGSLLGEGDKTKVVYDTFFRKEEIVHTFGWYLKHFNEKFIQNGVVPIFISPPVRCVWENKMILRTQSLVTASIMRQVCHSIGARFLDFSLVTEHYLNEIGEDRGRILYLHDDQVHTNMNGAKAYAGLLAMNLLDKYPFIFSRLLNTRYEA